MRQILSFAKCQQTFESIHQSVYSQDHPKRKRTPADMDLRNYPKPGAYLYNCQTETAIFLAAKHEKTIACTYLDFLNISFILNFWPAVL